jgi:predicted enzyme related to lactoylglutathione lyase
MAFADINPGEFIWHRLLASDTNAAKEFYTGLFGWEFHEVPYEHHPYTVFTLDGKSVAGLLPLPAGRDDIPSHWLSYMKVDNIAATIERALNLGAFLYIPVRIIQNIGHVAIIRDPNGAFIGLFEPLKVI